jgi:hypothetical protein
MLGNNGRNFYMLLKTASQDSRSIKTGDTTALRRGTSRLALQGAAEILASPPHLAPSLDANVKYHGARPWHQIDALNSGH